MSSNWNMVTGANGFLGARLVKQLLERGERVQAFVRPDANLDQLRGLSGERFRLRVGDARMMDRVYAALRGCDRLYHAAASSSLDESDRESIFQDTVEGTEAVLEAARRASISRIVLTSSASTLGASKDTEPLDESAGFNLADPNSDSEAKYSAERIALERAERGQPIVIVNPAVLVGPGDWRPTPSGAQLVRYLGLSPSFRVSCFPGGFSYADVDDVAQGHILAMEKGEVGRRYVLGGDNLSHRDFYTLLSDITGLAEPSDEVSRDRAEMGALLAQWRARFGGPQPLFTKQMIEGYYGRYVFVSSEKAEKELGYVHRPARVALARACRWFLDNGYLPERVTKRARLELVTA